MLNKKAQTALELLIVLGGILIIGIVVVMILISTGSAKADDITQSDVAHTQLLDKSVFPPIIDNLKCVENDTNITIEMDVIDSVSKNKKDYCLVINGETTDYCNLPVNDKIYFNIFKIPENYYAIGLATRSNVNTISASSMTLSCSITGIGTGGTGGALLFTCPTGYTKVPGNPTYGTAYTKGGFCVMTWEAKADINDDNEGDTDTQCQAHTNGTSGWLGTWNLAAAGCNNPKIVSSANGFPIANVNRATAISLCATITNPDFDGTFRLINNEEWMTIARNLEQQPTNWNTGIVGQGSLKRGNAGLNETNVSYRYASGSWSSPPVYYNADYLGSPSPASQRTENSTARMILSNGENIWDFSGNLSEWVRNTVVAATEPVTLNPTTYTQGSYTEFTNINTQIFEFPLNRFMPSNQTWNSSKGTGMIATRWLSGSTTHGIYRSGNYGSTGTSTTKYEGIYNIMFNTTTTVSTGLGFRCVYIPQ